MKELLLIPGPVTVAPQVREAAARPLINHRGPAFATMLKRITTGMQPIFGTQQPVVILGSSGTGAMEAAVANCFGPGDTVLACPVGAFGQRFVTIARTYGCNVEILEAPIGQALDPSALRARLEADSQRRITGVLLTHNETSTGVQLDLKALAPILRAHGALTLVDSVSGLGAMPFAMDEWGYDVVVTASQKALAAPPGIAMVAASKRAWERMERTATPRFYLDLRKARDFGEKGQTPWTPPVSILFALDVALERYHAEGAPAVFERHSHYAAFVRNALEGLGFTFVSTPEAHSVTVVAAYPPSSVDAAALVATLREEHGIVLAGGQGELTGKIIRFGVMGDITEAELGVAVDAIKGLVAGLTAV